MSDEPEYKLCRECLKYGRQTIIAKWPDDNYRDLGYHRYIKKEYCEQHAQERQRAQKASWARNKRQSNRLQKKKLQIERDNLKELYDRQVETMALIEQKNNMLNEYIDSLKEKIARLESEA